jgi:hypothetical protein
VAQITFKIEDNTLKADFDFEPASEWEACFDSLIDNDYWCETCCCDCENDPVWPTSVTIDVSGVADNICDNCANFNKSYTLDLVESSTCYRRYSYSEAIIISPNFCDPEEICNWIEGECRITTGCLDNVLTWLVEFELICVCPFIFDASGNDSGTGMFPTSVEHNMWGSYGCLEGTITLNL